MSKLASGLCIYFPSTDLFAYPAGDEICRIAIGKIIKDGGITGGGDHGVIGMGYITAYEVENDPAFLGYYDVVKIKSAIFSKTEDADEVSSLVVDLKKCVPPSRHYKNILIKTSCTSITNLFER